VHYNRNVIQPLKIACSLKPMSAVSEGSSEQKCNVRMDVCFVLTDVACEHYYMYLLQNCTRSTYKSK